MSEIKYVEQPGVAPTRKVSYATLGAVGGSVAGQSLADAIVTLVAAAAQALTGVPLDDAVISALSLLTVAVISGLGALAGGWAVRERAAPEFTIKEGGAV